MLSSTPSVSVIIPTSRSDAHLREILTLKTDRASALEFLIIIDNPDDQMGSIIQNIIESVAHQGEIRVFQNQTILGAPVSRNIGLKEAVGELIIFLDDDIIPQVNLIDAYIDALAGTTFSGALGVTQIPFDRGIVLEHAIAKVGFAYAYTMADHYELHSWGPTCNLAIIRDVQIANNVFFDPIFPKGGGGEDVDFCWRLRSSESNKLKSAPEALACHPPWKRFGNNLRRFYRWGVADVPLNNRHQHRRFRDFPNFIEFHLAVLLLVLGWAFWESELTPITFLIILLPVSFLCVSLSEVYNLHTDPLTAMTALLLVAIHEFGRIAGIVRWRKPHLILARTLYFDGDSPWRTRKRSLRNLGAMGVAVFFSGAIWNHYIV